MADKNHPDKASWEDELTALRQRLSQQEQVVPAEAAPSLEGAVQRGRWRRTLRWTGVAFLIALALWAVLLGSLWLYENRPLPPPGTVKGQVVDLDGLPVPGAVVTVEGFDQFRAVSQADGTFILPGVPGGTRWIRVELPGHAGVTVPVEVPSSQEVDIGTVTLWR